MDVILRKTNKKKLVAVFNDWKKASQKESLARNEASQRQKLFHDILTNEKKKSGGVIAGTLQGIPMLWSQIQKGQGSRSV